MENKLKIHLLIAIVTIVGAIKPISHQSTDKTKAVSILDYVRQQYDKFRPGPEKDIVLIIGNTDSRKSSVASLIAGTDLKSIKIDGVFHVVRTYDNDNGEDNLLKTSEIIPYLIKDELTGGAFYVCPGFNETRSIERDLAWTFAIRKLLNTGRSVKFILTLSYPSIRNEYAWNRDDFLKLVRYATLLIENISRYRSAIALIITNVPNEYRIINDKKVIDNNDFAAIERISLFFRQIQENLKRRVLKHFTNEEKLRIGRRIEFIDTLLEKEDEQYLRIGILRAIENDGPLMPHIMDEQETILKIVNENLEFIKTNSNDFGYSISTKSKDIVGDIIEKLNDDFNNDFDDICKDIRRFIWQKEKYTFNNLNESIKMAKLIKQELYQVTSFEPKLFEVQLIRTLNILDIQLLTRNMKNLMEYIEFIDFLQTFSYTNLTISNNILDQIAKQRIYLQNSEIWYQFLEFYHEKLSQYDIQLHKYKFNSSVLMSIAIIDEYVEIPVTELGVSSIIETVLSNVDNSIESLPINMFKLKQLQGIYKQTMQNTSIKCTSDGKYLIVSGYNVLISDIFTANCWQTANKIDISAQNKVFLNSNIYKKTAYLSIIAPTWVIHLESGESNRQIQLDGEINKNGTKNILKGQFFGIGQKINNVELKIQVSDCHLERNFFSWCFQIYGLDATNITVTGQNANESDDRLCTNPLPSLIRYKYDVREHLATNIDVSVSSRLLQYLNQYNKINSLFTAIDLFDEFKSMEDHFFKLRNKHSFISYYASLRDRIIAYSRTFDRKTEEQNVLNYLYTAVMSRLFALKSNANRISVVNLIGYMKIAEFRMKNLQSVQKKTYIQQYCNEFKTSVDNKIQTAFDLIENTIVPNINELHNRLDKQIEELIEETINRKHQNEKEKKKADSNKKKLEKMFYLHIGTGIVRTLGSAVSNLALIPGAELVGNVVGNTVDWIFKSEYEKINIPKNIAVESVLRIAKYTKSQIIQVARQLSAVRMIFKNHNSSDFESIIQKINNISTKIDKHPPDEISDSGTLKLAKQTIDDIDKYLVKRIKDLKKNKDQEDLKVKENIKLTETRRAALATGETLLKIVDAGSSDHEKIVQINNIISKLQYQIGILDLHRKSIDNVMLPRLEMIELSLKEAIKNAGNKSHAELDISKWAIQGALNEIKKTFNEMTETFAVAPEIKHSLEQLNVGINSIIDVYDQIDSYRENVQLATLITDAAIAPNEIKDDQLKRAVFKIERIIDANLLLEQYEVAMNALKQHKFPFAEQYLDQFQLPSNSSTIDDAFTIGAINAISEWIARIKQSESLIDEMDSYLYSNYTFINHESFFNWDNFTYKDEIVQLMNGHDVIFVADIDAGLKFNAIKFNEIWLKFKLKNLDIQKEFDVVIQKFAVVMEMIGHSFYRCNNRIYRVAIENTVRISFTLESGQPWKVNNVYSKLKSSDPFLSPYSVWKISLVSKNIDDADFIHLKRYQNHVIKIALEGRGQYLDNEAKSIRQTCNDRLDKYYRLESIDDISL